MLVLKNPEYLRQNCSKLLKEAVRILGILLADLLPSGASRTLGLVSALSEKAGH